MMTREKHVDEHVLFGLKKEQVEWNVRRVVISVYDRLMWQLQYLGL